METLVSLSLSASSALAADPTTVTNLSAESALTALSGIVTNYQDGLAYSGKYVGKESAPQDIRRIRRQVFELMRRMGQPVIIKHMFSDLDVQAGLAETSPNYNTVYGQTRNNDPLSYGIGLVSVEKSENEWINTSTGTLVVADDQPASNFIPAPKYRGFGPGYVTYIIEPDRAEDFFRLDRTGALMRIQQATVNMGWFPQVNDNDLIINAILDQNGRVFRTTERYQAKMSNPITMRGRDRRGRGERPGDAGNRYLINQQFEMTLLPTNSVLMRVDSDR